MGHLESKGLVIKRRPSINAVQQWAGWNEKKKKKKEPNRNHNNKKRGKSGEEPRALVTTNAQSPRLDIKVGEKKRKKCLLNFIITKRS